MHRPKPEGIYPLLKDFIKEAEAWLNNKYDMTVQEKLLDLYFEVSSFMRIYEIYDERYVTYMDMTGSDVMLKLFCVDPYIKTLIQEGNMTEEGRERFLNCFTDNPGDILIGFAVLGGIFSEGIDLIGDRLSGAIIVGVGIPQISYERDIILDYFKEKNGYGYEYAYMFPGMNKVLQAAGRVIRSEKDRGVVLLIDDRFAQHSYKILFPNHWEHYKIVSNYKDMVTVAKEFWH